MTNPGPEALLLALLATLAGALLLPRQLAAQPSELASIEMEAAESYRVDCNYKNLYGAGGPTVTAATCSAERTDGSDPAPSGILEGAATFEGQVVSQRITPTNRRGNTYRVHCLATMTNGDKSACNYRVVVREPR